MEKIINGEKFEIYELDGELRIKRNGFNMPLDEFEKLLTLNPKFYELSSEEILTLLHKLYPNGSYCR